MRTTASIGVLLCISLTGCSGLVRGFVDTQPRVELSDTLDIAAVVNGEPVTYMLHGEAIDDSAIDTDLLRHAPVIVQGFQPRGESSLRYDRNDDALGSPYLTADALTVRIDTDEPRVYSRVEHAVVGGVELKQLVYAFWYPSRPVGSIETGSVDGGVLRITLDRMGQPAVFEYTQPCGCFHGVFVSEQANAAAAEEFGAAATKRMYAVEPPLTGRDDWVVRGLVNVVPDGRLTLLVSAGKHACQTIRYLPRDMSEQTETRGYVLAPYDSLCRIPRDGGGEASMFDQDGRVLGAKRGAEQLVMGDLDHAGWPRHLDKMLLHWDTERWTDPALLASRLRLPSVLTGRAAPMAAAENPASSVCAPAAPASADGTNQGRQLLLFTNKSCMGCQMTKKAINESAGLRKLMRGWQYRVIDTATDEGRQLAAQERITMVPVLVGLAGDREIFREEDIDTPDKIAAVIKEHE